MYDVIISFLHIIDPIYQDHGKCRFTLRAEISACLKKRDIFNKTDT